jgi:hypothetical protein
VSAFTDLLRLQAPRDVCLAAADDATRQRCVRVIQAASAGVSSSLQDIASAAALTAELLKMKSLPAVNAVLAALGKAEVGGLDDVSRLMVDFGYDAVASSGCDVGIYSALKGQDINAFILVHLPLPRKVHSTGREPQRKRRAPNPRPHTL